MNSSSMGCIFFTAVVNVTSHSIEVKGVTLMMPEGYKYRIQTLASTDVLTICVDGAYIIRILLTSEFQLG